MNKYNKIDKAYQVVEKMQMTLADSLLYYETKIECEVYQ